MKRLGVEMAGGEDPGGGGFIPAPRPRGFGKGRLKGVPPVTGGQGGVGGDGGVRGGALRGEGGRGRQGGLPLSVKKMLDERKTKLVVSLNFHMFMDLPEVMNLHKWMKEEQLFGQEMRDDPRKGIDWIESNQYAKKFYIHMKEEQGAAWLMGQYGEEGRDWVVNEETKETRRIMARWEGGPTWKELVIKGINPNTPQNVVKEVFGKYGELKELKFVELDGIRYNEASVLVKVEEGSQIPVFVFSTGDDGELKERWEVMYKGRPNVCYGCYQPGHTRRDCHNQQVTFETLRDGGGEASWAQVAKGQRRAVVPAPERELEGDGRQVVAGGERQEASGNEAFRNLLEAGEQVEQVEAGDLRQVEALASGDTRGQEVQEAGALGQVEALAGGDTRGQEVQDGSGRDTMDHFQLRQNLIKNDCGILDEEPSIDSTEDVEDKEERQPKRPASPTMLQAPQTPDKKRKGDDSDSDTTVTEEDEEKGRESDNGQ